MKEIKLHDLAFVPFISAEEIKNVVDGIASKLDHAYDGMNPVLLVVLNGAFIFAADLVRQLSIPLRLDFIKVSSYIDSQSSGKMGEHFLWQTPLSGQHVLIVEDIVDSGNTLDYLRKKISQEQPASIEVTCLLIKHAAYQFPEIIKYEGLSIPNDFVVGYGMDYNGLGRDLDCIYRKKD